jgi:hypothetical protein
LAPAVWLAGVWLAGVAGVWVTEVVPADVGATVLLVSCLTSLDPLGEPSLLADSRTDIEGFEPPVPPKGTVVLVTGLTVVLVVAGTVVAVAVGAAGATVVAVPWAPEAPAGGEAGAVSAEAGPEPRNRKTPARSAKDAAHLRGLTTSFLGLELICWERPLVVRACVVLRARRPKHHRRDGGFLTWAPRPGKHRLGR